HWRAGAFSGRLRLPDQIPAHASGIRRSAWQERARTRKGKLPDHGKSEALAAAVPTIAGHGKAEQDNLRQTYRRCAWSTATLRLLSYRKGRVHRVVLLPIFKRLPLCSAFDGELDGAW